MDNLTDSGVPEIVGIALREDKALKKGTSVKYIHLCLAHHAQTQIS